MSKIYRRPMFRGGGTVSSYGNGIATGLADGGRVNLQVGGKPTDRFTGFKSGQVPNQNEFLNFLNTQGGSQLGPVVTGGAISDAAMKRFQTPEFYEDYIKLDEGENETLLNSPIMDYSKIGIPGKKSNYLNLGGAKGMGETQSLADLMKTQLLDDIPSVKDSIPGGGAEITSIVENSVKEAEEKPGELITISNSSDDDPSVVNESDLSSIIDNYEQLLLKGTAERNEKRLKKARIDDLSNLGLNIFAKSTKPGADVKTMLGEAAEDLIKKPSRTETVLAKQEDSNDKIKQAAAMLGIKGEQAQKLYETKLKNKDSSGQTEKAVRYISSITGKDPKDALKDYLRKDSTFAETVGKYKKSEGALTSQGFGLAAEDFYESLYIDNIPTDGNVKKGDKAPGKENGIYTDNKNLILFEIKDEVIISSRNY